MDEAAKNALNALFDLLGFAEEEKQRALFDFKQKIAMDVLASVEPELPQEYREFVAKHGAAAVDPNDPMAQKVKEALKNMHSREEYQAKARESLRKTLPQYLEFMHSRLSEDDFARAQELISQIK